MYCQLTGREASQFPRLASKCSDYRKASRSESMPPGDSCSLYRGSTCCALATALALEGHHLQSQSRSLVVTHEAKGWLRHQYGMGRRCPGHRSRRFATLSACLWRARPERDRTS
jgi:hypothetical protein